MQFFQDEHFSWKILLIESFVIMMSVVLGFYLTGWRQEVAQEKKLDKALESIYSEIQYNQSRMEKLMPYYNVMSDTLEYLMDKKGGETALSLKEIPGFNTFKLPVLQVSAFKTAQANGILSNMDYELARNIFKVYNLQRKYKETINQITQGFISGDFDTVRDWFNVFEILAGRIYLVEIYYPELLKKMQEEYNVKVQERISNH